jgi:hypothetical protein
VGQFAIRSAQLLGAERVIAIDRSPERLLGQHLEFLDQILGLRVIERLAACLFGKRQSGVCPKPISSHS